MKKKNNFTYMTPKQYAELVGKTRQAVTKAIGQGRSMEGWQLVEELGQGYVIRIDKNWLEERQAKQKENENILP